MPRLKNTAFVQARPDSRSYTGYHRVARGLLYGLRVKKIPVVASYHTHFTSYFMLFTTLSLSNRPYGPICVGFPPALNTRMCLRNPCRYANRTGFPAKYADLVAWNRPAAFILTNDQHIGRNSQGSRRKPGSGYDGVQTGMGKGKWIPCRKTYELLHSRYPDVKTMVVGDGPALQEMQQSMPDTLFTGSPSGDDLAVAYAGQRMVFVFPSIIRDLRGNVTLEALRQWAYLPL